MASSNKDKDIADFIGMTGADEERAQFYLQSANWNLQAALETYFDNDLVPGEINRTDSNLDKMEEDVTNKTNDSSSASKSNPKFGTINQLNVEDDASSGEEGQAFYAGGSDSSGQQILGPRKSKKNPTKDIFESAQKYGANTVSSSEIPQQSSKGSSFVFKGAGFKLGSDIEPSQQISASLTPDQRQSKPKRKVIKFWKNGFSVDNGPLRNFEDPANKDFLNEIAKGNVPSELRSEVHNEEVNVDMEDHKEENYVKPKETLKAFGGTGYKLGSPVPNIMSESAEKPQSSSSSYTPSAPVFKVDDTKPVTTVQIRLSDGTRLAVKFNHDNTISDIRSIVRNARPNTGSFNLLTTFPNKILNDNNMTIADAKLLNSIIVQQLI